MKTSTLKSVTTRKEQLATWLKDNPEHPDYAIIWKDYNNLKEEQS